MNPPEPRRHALQQHDVGTPSGLGDELVEFEATRQARRLGYLADAEIVVTLQLQGFDPTTRDWLALERALVEYGYEVFRVWAEAGVLRTRAYQFASGRGVLGKERIPEGLRLSRDQAEELSSSLQAVSVEAFRAKSLADPKRTWRPDGGASIKTYYTGRCLMELPDVYEKWAAADAFDVDLVDDLALLEVDRRRRHGGRPDDAVGATEERLERRATIAMSVPDTEDREILEYMGQGYSQDEIAELLGYSTGRTYSVGAIESRLYRARRDAAGNLARAMRGDPT